MFVPQKLKSMCKLFQALCPEKDDTLREGQKGRKLQGSVNKACVTYRSQCCNYDMARHLLYTERSGDKKQSANQRS